MSTQRQKGYAGSHETASDEEDGKWDVVDSSIKGNEPQPSGQQGGEREDETFGHGKSTGVSKALVNLDARMTAYEQGITIAKAEVPGTGQVDKALIGAPQEALGLSREDQIAVLKSPWKELGKFAEDSGYFADIKLGSR